MIGARALIQTLVDSGVEANASAASRYAAGAGTIAGAAKAASSGSACQPRCWRPSV